MQVEETRALKIVCLECNRCFVKNAPGSWDDLCPNCTNTRYSVVDHQHGDFAVGANRVATEV